MHLVDGYNINTLSYRLFADFLEDCRNFVDFLLNFFVYHIGKREGVYDDMANAYSSVKSLALKNGELMEINIEVHIRRGINRFQIIGQNDSLRSPL